MARTGPHAGERVEYAGAPLENADAALIMLHGRGAAPHNILDLVGAIARPRIAYVAPAAAGGAWYPNTFMSPRERNEPWLSSALSVIESLVEDLIARGFPPEKIALLGFSQGACLACEFTIRHPRHYGALIALSGALIGPPGTSWDDVTSDVGDMRVFLGCSDVDSHIPKARVNESEAVFTLLGARVKKILYPGMGHLVNAGEIKEVQAVLDALHD